MDDLKLAKRAYNFEHTAYISLEKLYNLLGYVQGVQETTDMIELSIIESKIKKIISGLE